LIDTNRIDHVVWAVHPENLDKSVTQLAALLNTTFEEFEGVPGLHVFVSWDTGFEIATPTGDGPSGEVVRQFLTDKGEGIFAVVVRVPDLKTVSEHATGLGWPVAATASGSDETDRLWQRITRLREQFVGPFVGTMLFFGEVDYVP
jgi:hypothetical protein